MGNKPSTIRSYGNTEGRVVCDELMHAISKSGNRREDVHARVDSSCCVVRRCFDQSDRGSAIPRAQQTPLCYWLESV